jgi:hypothetical protein
MQNVLPLRLKREVPRAVPRPRPVPDDVVPEPVAPADVQPVSLAPVAAETRPASAIARAVTRVDGVELGSLASIAVRCALVVTVVGALAIAGLWVLASSSGTVDRTESFMQSIGFRDFSISAGDVLLGATLITAGAALTIATAVVVAGAAYNLLAARGHGLRIRVALPAVPELADDHRVAEAGDSIAAR